MDEPSENHRPNIVYIFSDQHRHDALGCAGNPVAMTPNLDRLAAEGVRFARTWCASPICRPSRASVITAAHPHQHGVVANDSEDFDPAWPTMMKALRKVGYQTAHVGKSHYHQPGYLKLLEEGKSLDTRDRSEYVASFGFDHVLEEFDRYVHTAPHVSTPYKEFLAEHGVLERYQEQITSLWRGTPTHWKGETSVLPQELDLTSFIADRAIDWIDTVDASRAFFLQLSFVAPHVPLVADPEWSSHYADTEIPRGPLDAPAPTNETWGDYVNDLRHHAQAGVHDDEFLLAGARQYYGMVSLIDQRIGDVFAALERRGLLDNTWIVFSADHGEMLGDHQLMGKMGFYRTSVQVPGIIRPPGGMQSRVVDDPVSSLDLTATIVDIADADTIEHSAGRSLLAALDGGPVPAAPVFSTIQPIVPVGVPEHVAPRPDEKPLFVAVYDGRHRFTLEARNRTPCELFDHDDDPDESSNLVADPDRAVQVADFEALIADFLTTEGGVSR
jgi:arylsulfatase